MKKKTFLIPDVGGGVWFEEIFWAGFAMPRMNPWDKLPWGSTSTFFLIKKCLLKVRYEQ